MLMLNVYRLSRRELIVSRITLAILKIISRLDFGKGPDCPLTLDEQGGFRCTYSTIV